MYTYKILFMNCYVIGCLNVDVYRFMRARYACGRIVPFKHLEDASLYTYSWKKHALFFGDLCSPTFICFMQLYDVSLNDNHVACDGTLIWWQESLIFWRYPHVR